MSEERIVELEKIVAEQGETIRTLSTNHEYRVQEIAEYKAKIRALETVTSIPPMADLDHLARSMYPCLNRMECWPQGETDPEKGAVGVILHGLRMAREGMVPAPDASCPVPMYLTCPKCNARHIDRGVFATKPHHTHSCQGCGLTWRPAVGPTVGVEFLPGFKDEPVGVCEHEFAAMVRSIEDALERQRELMAKFVESERFRSGYDGHRAAGGDKPISAYLADVIRAGIAERPDGREVMRDWKPLSAEDLRRCVDELMQKWISPYGTTTFVSSSNGEGWRLRLVTGGWSENESILDELHGSMFWLLCWRSSTRGGECVFDYRFHDVET